MKKFVVIIICLVFSAVLCAAKSRPKCKNDILFFENLPKNEAFSYIDAYLQTNNFEVTRFYQELGFVEFLYKKKYTITIDIKQYGNDVYVFLDSEPKKNKFNDDIFDAVKPYSPNSYKLRDDIFCREFKKDVASIRTKRKPKMEDNIFNPYVYEISMKRYVGFKKTSLFWKNLKDKFKFKKKSKKTNKTENTL